MSRVVRHCLATRVLALSLLGVLATAVSLARAQSAAAAAPGASAPADGKGKVEVEPEEAPAPGAAASAPRRPPLVWRLQVDAPEPFGQLLRNHLDLARFQQEAAKDSSLRISRSELRRLVASAPEQARALIEAEGYFASRIVTRVSEEVDGQPVVVTIAVTPGERATVSQVQMVFEGELDTRLGRDDADAKALTEQLQSDWALPAGEFFRQSDWASAKNATLARLRAQGYPQASWSGTSVTVDAQQGTAKLFLVADSGVAFSFGDIRVEGLVRQPASAVVNLAPFGKGSPYREGQLLDWQERIQKLNLFDNIFVSTDLDASQAEGVPVVVQVRELPMQTATAGIGVSSDTGPRVSLEHLHRNLWGLDWQAKTKLQLGLKESNGTLDLTSHPWPGRRRGLVSLQSSYLVDTDNAVSTGQRLRVGVLREGERLERTNYLEYQRAEVRSDQGMVVSNASALSATTQLIFRDVDSQTLPTQGSTSLGQLTVGRTFSALEDAGLFSRAYARVTGYQTLPGHWYASVRGELGQVFARDAVSVPDTLLFRAGGDDSVRGYAYRSLGVVKDGVTVGGRSTATGSLELAHPLSARLPSLWGAVFVDAGDAAERFSDLQPKVGYGAGVRWRSPVGPLKLDVAYGTEVQRWRFHFSVGISL